MPVLSSRPLRAVVHRLVVVALISTPVFALQVPAGHAAPGDVSIIPADAAPTTVYINGSPLDVDPTGFTHWGQQAQLLTSRREVRVPYGNTFTVSVSAAAASYFAINFVTETSPGHQSYDVTASAQTSADGVVFGTSTDASVGCGDTLISDDPSTDDPAPFGDALIARSVFRATTTSATTFTCHVRFTRGQGVGVYLEVGPTVSAQGRVDIRDPDAEVFAFTVFSEADSITDDLIDFRDGIAATISAATYPSTVSAWTVTASAHGLVPGQAILVDFSEGANDDDPTGTWTVHEVVSNDEFTLTTFGFDDWRRQVTISAQTVVSVSALSLRLAPCVEDSPGPCLESIEPGWGAQLDDSTFTECWGWELCLEVGVYRVSASATSGFGTAPGDSVDLAVRLPVGEFRGVPWGEDATTGVNNMTLDATASLADYSVTRSAVSAVHAFSVQARERSITVDSGQYEDRCGLWIDDGTPDSWNCDLPNDAVAISQIKVSSPTVAAVPRKATKVITGYTITTSAIVGVYDVTVSVEALHGYEIGDVVTLSMPGTPLDGLATPIIGIGGLTPDVSNIFEVTVSAGSDIATACNGMCAITPGNYVEVTTLTAHGFATGAAVTITLLGSRYDGTKDDITVIDPSRFRYPLDDMVSNEFTQQRDGLVREGWTSSVVLTDTSIRLSLREVVLDETAPVVDGLAGGYVATNGQRYVLGVGLSNLQSPSFDFAVAGPSEKADRSSRSNDGFFEMCIPAGFLQAAFGLTIAQAQSQIIVTRDDGTTALTGLTVSASHCGVGPGLRITNPAFGYSTPYFAARKAPSQNVGDPGGVVTTPTNPSTPTGPTPGTVTSPTPGALPTLVTPGARSNFQAPAGSARGRVGGVQVTANLTQAPTDATPTAIRQHATRLLDRLAGAAGGASLPVSSQQTSSGATIRGLAVNPAQPSQAVAIPAEDVVLVQVASSAVMMAGISATGAPAQVGADGVLELPSGGALATLTYGFTPNTPGEIIVLSSPRLLGRFTTSTDGSFTGQVSLPASLPAGDHTIVIATASRSISLGVRVTGSGGFAPVAPRRLLDTRTGTTPAAASTVTVDVIGGPVPQAASAVAVNITATRITGPGYVTAWACGSARPDTSTLNLADGDVANAAVVPVGTNGTICLSPSAGTDLIVDVTGYYAADAAGRFTPVTARRMLDTRSTSRAAAGSTTQTVISNVPTGASSVAVNVTAVNASAAGYVTAWACGTIRPEASSLNYGAGDTAAGSVIVALGTGQRLCLYTSAAADLLVDVAGWFGPTGSGDLEIVTPTRAFDSRATSALLPGVVRRIDVRSLVDGAGTVVVNLTGVGPLTDGYLTAYNCAATPPEVSNLNLRAGGTRANQAIVAVASSGEICLVGSAATHAIVDVVARYR